MIIMLVKWLQWWQLLMIQAPEVKGAWFWLYVALVCTFPCFVELVEDWNYVRNTVYLILFVVLWLSL